MIDHAACRRAIRTHPRPLAYDWSCTCGKRLAWIEPGMVGIALTSELVPSGDRHDKLPTYAPPPRVQRGQRPRRSARALAPTRRLDVFVTCPACGKGQHLEE